MRKNKKLVKIGVTGGKGGVGKSTVAVLIALELARKGKNIVLVDCDVECPNDYLLLGQVLKNPIEKAYAQFPKLDKRKCRKCGICVEACRNNAIFQPPGGYPIFIKSLCSGCGACWNICPFGAISVKNEQIGKIYFSQIKKLGNKHSGKISLITGLAKEALEESLPVVKKAKQVGLNIAEKEKADYLIFDTAAGTHCPVINALMGVDFAFVVTEPTPMGAHDLKLILGVLKKIKVEPKVILNQANLGSKEIIEKVIKEFKLTIEKEIPYSEELVKNYSKGKLLNFQSLDFDKL